MADSRNDDPPNSRLFVVCSKLMEDDEIEDLFKPYGDILDFRRLKDRQTGSPKGIAYIKFAKTSQAATAMEEMDGKICKKYDRPMKVMIAQSKDFDPKRDQSEAHRLFIIVPKSATEEELTEHFKQFGSLESVTIVKNRETRESKGLAYVKYQKASHCARAFEECDRQYKAVFARPKEAKSFSSDLSDSSHNNKFPNSFGSQRFDSGGPGDIINKTPNADNYTRLLAVFNTNVSHSNLFKLFDLIPGLESVFPANNHRMGFRNEYSFVVQYAWPQSAAYAREKLDGFEYPPGYPVLIKPEYYEGRDRDMSFGRNQRNNLLPADPGVSADHLLSITKALSQATALLKAAGLSTDGIELNDLPNQYGSLRLPPPQPLAPAGTTSEIRLFIVAQPALPPMHIIRDIFCRFGHITDIHVLHGKNCGYVSYAKKDSGANAILHLHGQEIGQSRLKVMEAEPPRNDSRKRTRVEAEES
ncbi:RNA-binding protein 45 [Bemisia tabaci]|nr:PREDICTED: RNA-binding protein 45 isoform X2 [Bemisia tabaci]